MRGSMAIPSGPGGEIVRRRPAVSAQGCHADKVRTPAKQLSGHVKHIRDNSTLKTWKAGWTQQALAKRLGQPQSFVAKYEGGERRLGVLDRLIGGPSAGSLLRVALIRAPTPVSQSYGELI
jgi:hypothetical protein